MVGVLGESVGGVPPLDHDKALIGVLVVMGIARDM